MATPERSEATRSSAWMGPWRAGGLAPWVGSSLVGLAAVAASANTLLNGFVYDDNVNILGNPWIREPGLLGRAFESHVAAFDPNTNTSFYRPLMHVIYACAYSLFGLQAWGFHLVSLVFHVAVSLCVYALLRRFCVQAERPQSGGGPGSSAQPPGAAALIGAVLFAVHPIHSESVAWLSGITDLSYSLFLLLSLLVATSSAVPRSARLVVAPALFLIATLCKEPAVMLLPVLVVALTTRGDLSDPSRRRDTILQLSAYLVAALLYLALRTRALGGLAGSDRRVQVSLREGVATGIALLGEYLKKLAIPTDLSPMHDFQVVTSALDPALWIGVIVMAAVLIGAVCLRRHPGAMLGLALLVLPLLPALYLPALGEGFFAERYLYLPSAGAVLLVAIGLESLDRGSAVRRLAMAASAGVALIFAFATFERNAVWRSDLSLWEDAAPKVPGRAGAQEALGTAQLFSGRHDEAIAHLARALELDPTLNDARVNMAASLCLLGRTEEAIAQLGIVLRERPTHPEAQAALGWAFMLQGRLAEGIAAYERALAIKPSLWKAHKALGMAYAQLGDQKRAAWHFQEAMRLDPANPDHARSLQLPQR